MDFKEKPAELKVACPLCGLARPTVRPSENDESVCHCGLFDYEHVNPNVIARVGDVHPPDREAKSEHVDDVRVTALVDDDGDEEGQIRDFTGSTLIKDDFQVLSLLGQGCVTDTYLVRNKTLKQKFVLKILVASYNKNPRTSKRFRIATTKAAQLSHPNIVTVYEADQAADGSSYAVSEYIESPTLADVIKREGFLDTHEVVETMMQACEALQYAYENKIVHRGLKPSNIFLVNRKPEKFSVKVSDFGTAVALPHAGRETQVRPTHIREFGDPRYMSPEQCVGERLTPASDIYSLGCVMYEALCGKTPFAAKNPMTIAVKQMTEEVRTISSRFKDLDIPADLEAIVMRALMKDPRKRYQTPAEMLKDLQRVAKNKPLAKPVEAYLATKSMLTNSQDWLSDKVEAGNLRAITFALMVVAVILGLIAIWFLFGSPSGDPIVNYIHDMMPSSSLSDTDKSRIQTFLGPAVSPQLTTLRDTHGNFLYSSHTSNVRYAVEEALRHHVSLVGVDLSGQNLATLNGNDSDFSNADFSNSAMNGCTLERAKLNKANFSGASLNGANLSNAVAPGALFIFTMLKGTSLHGAQLAGADFRHSDMNCTNLSNAQLSDCNFDMVKAQNANFGGSEGTPLRMKGASFLGCHLDGSVEEPINNTVSNHAPNGESKNLFYR